MAEREGVRFRDVQRLHPVRRVVIVGLLFGVAFLPQPTEVSVVIIVLLVTLCVHAYAVTLQTEVRTDGLWVRLRPVHWRLRRIPLTNVASCGVRTFHVCCRWWWLGIARFRKGVGYIVRGAKAVQIDYADGRHVVIGSQRPEELAEAIRALLESKGGRKEAR